MVWWPTDRPEEREQEGVTSLVLFIITLVRYLGALHLAAGSFGSTVAEGFSGKRNVVRWLMVAFRRIPGVALLGVKVVDSELAL